MFIDTHCHLQFEQFNDDRSMVIGNAKKAGVKKIITPGVDSFSSRLALELAQKNPNTLFASIGYHPYEASHSPDLLFLKTYLDNPTVVAVGECGLDYHLFKGEAATGKKQEQKILFEEQLRLALTHNLPVIMHCRDAYEDFFDVLDNLPSMPRGVIHCFSGGLQELRFAAARGLYVGLDGNVTYSKQLSLIVPNISLSMLLLETDAPYLTPAPHRGQRNEPKHIPLIAQHIAGLMNTPLATVESQTTQNALTLFTRIVV
jgi:TatD DNase family protein